MENAQAQDQERCEEALRPHRQRQGEAQLGPQAASPDQQVEAAEAPASRHDDDGKGRQQAGADLYAVYARLRAGRWPGSNAALRRMPGTRRCWGSPRGIAGVAAPPTGWRSKRSRKRCATPTATAATRSAIFAGCGSSGSTLACENTDLPTLSSCTV